MNTYSDIPKNTIAFLALCKEYCVAVEGVSDTELPAFIDTMLRLLPRLYISAADIPQSDTDDYYVTQALTEDYYDNVRRRIAPASPKDWLTCFRCSTTSVPPLPTMLPSRR